MRLVNRVVVGLLNSPLRGWLRGSTGVIRYVGRRSGKTFITPVQYAKLDDGIVIMSGRPATKKWWHNFRDGHDVDVLLDGEWVSMTGVARIGAEDPASADPLLKVYLDRFPKVARSLPTDPVERVRSVVLVECHRH